MQAFYDTPQIIVPLRPRSLAELRRLLPRAQKVADVVEIWLDRLQPLTAETVAAAARLPTKPAIFNLKDARECGEFAGGTAERLQLLDAAAAAGAAFVDLPLHLPASQLTKFRQKHPGIQLIISWHDFAKMPSLTRLRLLAQRAQKCGADIVKLVGTASTVADCLPILQISRALATQKIPHFALAMGAAGQLTRVLTPLLGAAGTFAALDPKSATAPGQLTAAEVKKWWQRFAIAQK